jgi:hypothetical protein
MELRQFYLPVGSVRDVNDLSLLSFIKDGDFTVCLPGDLNARGWRIYMLAGTSKRPITTPASPA